MTAPAMTELEHEMPETLFRKLDEALKNLSEEKREIEPRGIFKPLWQTVNNLPASGQTTVDFGMPAKGRVWMVRELIVFEQGHEATSIGTSQATSTGAAGAATSATLPFFSPFMTGFDVEIQPATTAGVATITVTGSGVPTLTYYLEESTTNTVSKNIRYPGSGLANYTQVSVSAVASGGIVTVNVYGLLAGSPAGVVWYNGSPDTSTGLSTQRPPFSGYRWFQGKSNAGSPNYMPFDDFFTHRAFPVTSPDHLVAFLIGGIGGENFAFGAIVEEFRIRDMEAMDLP